VVRESVCKRSTDDPLIRLFLDRYGLHLLQVPRESAVVGDFYVDDGRRVSPPGNMKYLLDPPPELPAPKEGERMADIEGVTSKGYSLEVGLGLLEGFLLAFGAGPLTLKVKTEYEAKRVQSLRFRITAPTRDSLDPFELGAALVGKKPVEDHPWWSGENRYYLATAVTRTSSISVVAEDDGSSGAEVDVEALKVAGASGGFTLERGSESEVLYKGDRPLAFGVELCELSYDPNRRSLRLKAPEDVVRVRGPSAEAPEELRLRSFIGGEDGDAFLKLA
jgi:hypothetical protein